MKLNEYQDEAVHTKEDKVIVIAGAGSGKTTVITERARTLLSDTSIDPYSVVLITYTNLAAEEMMMRLHESNCPNLDKCFIGTVHSFANKLLREDGQYYKVYDTDDEQYVLGAMTNRLVRLAKSMRADNIGSWNITLLKNEYLPARYEGIDCSDTEFSYRNDKPAKQERYYDNLRYKICKIAKYRSWSMPTKLLAAIHNWEVKKYLKDHNKITFDQIILKSTDSIDSGNHSVDKYHILVDEFQDIGNLEYKFIDRLPKASSFYVGDDWQAIYSFKGGCIDYIFQLAQDPEYKVYALPDNYRCCREVVDSAKKMIKKTSQYMDKRVIVHNSTPGDIIHNADYRAELAQIKNSKDYGSWFILTRTNSQLDKVVSDLEWFKIPYQTFKKSDMTTKSELDNSLNNDVVTVMTIHGSKGLEKEKVLLYVPDHPAYQTNPRYDPTDEEYRLMYVGETRAKSVLRVVTREDEE